MKGAKPVIGLAGGIASGKSLVARILADLGAVVIDSDLLNREVLKRPDVCEQIQTWWGEDTYNQDGSCNRRRIAEIVFDDPEQKKNWRI